MLKNISIPIKPLLILLLIGLGNTAYAENHVIELPKCISSHMVLQRETPVKLWGWGTPGDTIIVELTRQGQIFKDSVKVDENKRWLIRLPAQPVCSEACKLKFHIKGHPEITQTLDDILIGDVWFAGGQSNMEKKVNYMLETGQYTQEADNYPQIRSFRASYYPQTSPQERVNSASGTWFVCNSTEIADKVSAVAYVYARSLYENLNIPIGIMQSYRGGTEIETWMSPGIFNDPELCKIAGRKAYITPGTASQDHSLHFNGQINPLLNFPIKGFIFYQGESNIKRALEYRFMMRKLIEDWRNLWGMGDLPFYYVQLPNIYATSSYDESNWPDCREQQALLLSDYMANLGMAVTIDTNDEALNPDNNINIHPHNKKPVGERLARIALKNTYHFDILAEGPAVNRYEFSGNSVYLYFKNYGDGLKIKAGESSLKGFIISGSDKKFYTATATIHDDSTVVVSSSSVSSPVAVRYDWARNPIGNLYNSIDIPATPFRTDIWKSKFTYTSFQSSCTSKSSDADLMMIKVNGVTLPDFDPQKLTYNYIPENQNYQDVSAVTNNPFASIVKVETENKVTLKVTAENGSVQSYEINFKSPTSIPENTIQLFHVFQENKKIIIQNNSGKQHQIKIYNHNGQHIISDKIKENEQKTYTLPLGVYIIDWINSGQSNSMKFILK